jgi:hypothetical protein
VFFSGVNNTARPPLSGVGWSDTMIQVPVTVKPGSTLTVSIKVTDVYMTGDNFELWSVNDGVAPTSGTLIGTTPAVPSTGQYIGPLPDAAYLNSSFSHAEFFFPITSSGTYNFTIRTVTSPVGYFDSEGYMKFSVPSSVGGYVITSNGASILTSLLLPFAVFGALGLAVAYRKKLKF